MPTTGFPQPRSSSLVIICGSTASVDDVANTITNSSLMYLRNFHSDTRFARAIGPRTNTMKITLVRYTPAINHPSGASEARPYFPTVKAIDPNAATGARYMIIRTIPNNPCNTESITSTINLPRSGNWASATPNN